MNAIRPPSSRLRIVTPKIPPPPPLPGVYDLKKARRLLLSLSGVGWLISAAALDMAVGITVTVMCGMFGWVLERSFKNSLRQR